MITELTPEQEAKVEVYRDKWLKIGLSTDRIDREKCKSSIEWVYEFADFKKPEIVFCNNPLQVQEKSNDAKKSNEFNPFFSPNLECYWVGFFDFILNELFPERRDEFAMFNGPCRDFYTNVHHMVAFEGLCFTSEKPLHIHRNEKSELHSLAGAALIYRDNYELYFLDGIAISKDILDNITHHRSASDILSLKNVEQRLVVIKYYGVENMLQELNAKVIDTKDDEYVLYEIELEGSKEKLLEMQNPSEPKKHYEFVTPDIDTVVKALAWRAGIEVFKEPSAKS